MDPGVGHYRAGLLPRVFSVKAHVWKAAANPVETKQITRDTSSVCVDLINDEDFGLMT